MGLLRNLYKKTSWINNKTSVDAEKLNNIENGIERLYDSCICASDFEAGDGVKIETTDSGKVKVSIKREIAIITEELEDYDPEVVYFLVSSNNVIQKIIINGVASNYGLGS